MKITSPPFYPNALELADQSQVIRHNIPVINNGMRRALTRSTEILPIQELRTPNRYHSLWTERNSVQFIPPSETTDQKNAPIP